MSMSHELLNNLWGNSFFKASTAEGMSQRMRMNFFKLYRSSVFKHGIDRFFIIDCIHHFIDFFLSNISADW